MKYLFFLLSFFSLKGIAAQVVQNNVDAGGRMNVITEPNSNIVNVIKPENIEGSPLFSDAWNKGDVLLLNNRIVKNLPLQINLEKNLVYFQKDDKRFQFLEPVLQCSFSVVNKGVAEQVLFRANYPVYKNNVQMTLYQVLAESAHAHLLKFSSKRIQETFVFNAPSVKTYILSEELLIYNTVSKTIHAVSNKKSVLAALPEQKERIEALCRENGWSLKTAAEMSKLIIQLQ